MIRRPPGSPPFPYTTLFRSSGASDRRARLARPPRRSPAVGAGGRGAMTAAARPPARSEEHTSELQSHLNLVCRLLLEKKKNHTKTSAASPAPATRRRHI